MKRPNIPLAVIESDGPRVIPQSDGATYTRQTPCFVCDGDIERGELISRVHGRWAHQSCAKTFITTAEVRTAWALIGEAIARRPRAYSARDIRTVVAQLASLVHEQVLQDELAEERQDPARRRLLCDITCGENCNECGRA